MTKMKSCYSKTVFGLYIYLSCTGNCATDWNFLPLSVVELQTCAHGQDVAYGRTMRMAVLRCTTLL